MDSRCPCWKALPYIIIERYGIKSMHTDCLHTGSVTMTRADAVRKKDKGKLSIE